MEHTNKKLLKGPTSSGRFVVRPVYKYEMIISIGLRRLNIAFIIFFPNPMQFASKLSREDVKSVNAVANVVQQSTLPADVKRKHVRAAFISLIASLFFFFCSSIFLPPISLRTHSFVRPFHPFFCVSRKPSMTLAQTWLMQVRVKQREHLPVPQRHLANSCRKTPVRISRRTAKTSESHKLW